MILVLLVVAAVAGALALLQFRHPATGAPETLVTGLLVAAGALITTLSGLCTAVYAVGELTTPTRLPNGGVALYSGPGMMIFAIPFGGIPITLGALLFATGYRGAALGPSKALGATLTVIGAIAVLSCGLATLGLTAFGVYDGVSHSRTMTDAAATIPGALMLCAIGLTPALLGIYVVRSGWSIYHGR